MYLALLIIAITGLVFTTKKMKTNNIKFILLFIILFVPITIFASENYDLTFKFTNIEVKDEFEKYTISFDSLGGSEVSDIKVNKGQAIGTLPTSKKSGLKLEGWYTATDYNTKVTADTIPTGDVTYYAKWEDPAVCVINQNVVAPAGIVCKRAETLHQEVCSRAAHTTLFCTSSGYTESGSKGTNIVTYGNCGIDGELNAGDGLTCDVNGDGTFDEASERFYYVSDYYNTTTKTFETDTAVLIYYNNVVNGVANNAQKIAYSTLAELIVQQQQMIIFMVLLH